MNIEQQERTRYPAGQPAGRPDRPSAGRNVALLPPAQRDVLQQALADAIFYRDPPVHCPDCATPDRLCPQCAAGMSQARAYLALSRELQISPADPDRPPGHALIPGDSAAGAASR